MKRNGGARISKATASVSGEAGTSKHESKVRSSDMTRRSEESRHVLRLEMLEKKVTELMGERAPDPGDGKSEW